VRISERLLPRRRPPLERVMLVISDAQTLRLNFGDLVHRVARGKLHWLKLDPDYQS
jgi:hypothetical protein